ncbi:hypothetical protein EUX98_g1688 [Antrodiella citrinella]|uniref:Uncharacterized protein n=1 Tax=Antrodiella citrinella TaxID=2447956 RepID=A0A4S4N393_9APHY|nr:hypothetical protein EUX98_g1688 [Antrodiella citrinella]
MFEKTILVKQALQKDFASVRLVLEPHWSSLQGFEEREDYAYIADSDGSGTEDVDNSDDSYIPSDSEEEEEEDNGGGDDDEEEESDENFWWGGNDSRRGSEEEVEVPDDDILSAFYSHANADIGCVVYENYS